MTDARDLAARLASLLRYERHAMAEFLVALAAFDDRKAWMKLGHASLFTFLHRDLGLSKGASHFRKVAAELIQRYPEVVEPLKDGRLCITSVVELARVITPENRVEVLPRFFHASKQEAKAIAAEIRPAESVPQREVVTMVPAAASRALLLPAATVETSSSAPVAMRQVDAEVRPVELVAPLALRPSPPTSVQPLTSEARRLHVTVSKRFLEKLEVAREALSHSHPGGDAEAILEAGLDLLIERAAKRKGLVKRPRPAPAPAVEGANPRHVPAAVRREVFLRDEGKCQWPLAGGGICGSTHRVELDHIVPVGRGGKATTPNCRVLCSLHNQLAAREIYGSEWMDQFTRRPDRRSPLHTPGP
ncbi:MAG TPA: HNH endonuclease signature motif containing protein [Anaeromyxobacteraceae bacterium]|nr:HNH endonuclease signature motif containing protein [Anaeromyxobacteraceae bacterium]